MFNNELWQKPAGGGGGDFYTHQIANSCRFNASATSHMYHTQGTPTNVDKCTISLWVKRGKLGAAIYAFTGSGSAAAGDYSHLSFGGTGNDPDLFYYLQNENSPVTVELESTALFRDPNAWMNLVIAQDSTQGTAANRNKIYINGVQYTDWGDFTQYSNLNSNFSINTSGHKIFVGSGGDSGGGAYLPYDGYIAEYVFIDGTQYAASDFGETKNGAWIPKDPSGLTFGNNGAYLKFESSSALGNDSSGNNNDFTLSNVSAHDQMLDSPTFNSDSNGGNFTALNPLAKFGGADNGIPTLTEGNLKADAFGGSSGNIKTVPATFGITSGKWYWEVYVNSQQAGLNIGLCNDFFNIDAELGYTSPSSPTGADVTGYYAGNGQTNDAYGSNGFTSYGDTFDTDGTIIGVAFDADNGKSFFSKNGTWQNSGNPATGANPARGAGGAVTTAFSFSKPWFPVVSSHAAASPIVTMNFGQEGTFAGAVTAQGNSDDTGYGNFYYAPPTGFLSLNSGNLPVADAVDPAQTDDNYPQKLFGAKTYTGTGSSNAITGVGFKPDWTWIKERSGANDHKLTDSTRGVTKSIESNEQIAQTTDSNGLTAFGTDGFTVGSDAVYNNSSDTYVGWNWRANGGTTASNGTGDITSTVQADPSGGFSIVTYTGSGTAGNTIGHGLSTTPDMIMIKNISSVDSWAVYNSYIGNTKHLVLDTGVAPVTSSAYWNSTSPTSSVFTVGTGDALNQNTKNYVAYCFANIEGYCKVGSYVGNAATNGTFVYTGFKPSFMLNKPLVAGNWRLVDNARSPYNVTQASLSPRNADAEDTDVSVNIDFLSNGFKMRNSDTPMNQGTTYIYLAFAENPFKYATAR